MNMIKRLREELRAWKNPEWKSNNIIRLSRFSRGVTGKFVSFFLIFFPEWNAFSRKKITILVHPKQILVVLKSEKQKKKKKKKKKVPPFLLQFSFFTSQSSPLPFFPCLFFPVGQQKFPGQKSLGALCPPPVTTLRFRCYPCVMLPMFFLNICNSAEHPIWSYRQPSFPCPKENI